MTSPPWAVQTALEAAHHSPCAKSKRGVEQQMRENLICTCSDATVSNFGFSLSDIPAGMHWCDCPVTNTHPELSWPGPKDKP